jgi:hypothetical protein
MQPHCYVIFTPLRKTKNRNIFPYFLSNAFTTYNVIEYLIDWVYFS